MKPEILCRPSFPKLSWIAHSQSTKRIAETGAGQFDELTSHHWHSLQARYTLVNVRRTSIVIVTSLLLSSCSAGGSSDSLQACTTRARVEPFSICVPDGWIAATSDFGSKGSSIITLVHSETDDPPLNIHVKHEPLAFPVTSSLQFAKRARELTAKQAPSYEFVSLSPITANGSPSLFHVFTAKPPGEERNIAYYQMVIPVEDEGYGFSATREREPLEDDDAVVRTIFESILFDSAEDDPGSGVGSEAEPTNSA